MLLPSIWSSRRSLSPLWWRLHTQSSLILVEPQHLICAVPGQVLSSLAIHTEAQAALAEFGTNGLIGFEGFLRLLASPGFVKICPRMCRQPCSLRHTCRRSPRCETTQPRQQQVLR